MSFRLRVVVLTEDGAVDVVQAVVRQLLSRVVDPATRTDRMRVEPYDPTHRPVVAGNAWMSRQARDQQRVTEFNKYLARELRTDPPLCVVTHHFDADEPWREGAVPDKLLRWRRVVHAAVGQLAGEAAADRLIALVAHPEMEAWLYLDEEVLRDLGVRHGRVLPSPPAGGWHTCRAVKDEHPWPGDAHNRDLARTWPAVRATEVSPSVRAAVQALQGVPGLVDALAATREDP